VYMNYMAPVNEGGYANFRIEKDERIGQKGFEAWPTGSASSLCKHGKEGINLIMMIALCH